MEYTTERNDGRIEVKLRGELTFSDSETFDEILKVLESEDLEACAIDFHDLQFIDSSGLSMLLLVHDISKSRKFDLRFVSPRGEVKDRLEFARFHTIVTIDV